MKRAAGHRGVSDRRGSGGSRRYQGKIFGKEESDELTIGLQARLQQKQQDVLLYVIAHAERHGTGLDSKTGSITPMDRPWYPCDNTAVTANRTCTCRYAWNPSQTAEVDEKRGLGAVCVRSFSCSPGECSDP
jgi:hypothetical protein